ncbi:MAG: AAA family ATPase, partial [Spirulina sp.]
MFLKRVQVPDFRVLQDVDITFEPDFFPKIFPLGSLNGGGKSTLLQLIFVLLHCSGDPNRIEFLKNLLFKFKVKENNHKRILATFEILHQNQSITLEFLVSQNSSFYELLGLEREESNKNLNFSIHVELEKIKSSQISKNNYIKNLESNLKNLERIKQIEDNENKQIRFQQECSKIGMIPGLTENLNNLSIEEVHKALEELIKSQKIELSSFDEKYKIFESKILEARTYLDSQNLIYICNYSSNDDKFEQDVLLCHIKDIDLSQGKSFLNEVSKKIFLTAPITQIFLFLNLQIRQSLFDTRSYFGNYNIAIKSAQSKLSNFFAYDFFALDLLLKSLIEARDRDFQEMTEKGEYGNSYKNLLQDLNSMLANKRINIKDNFDEVNFKLIQDNEEIELYPEDLSHGELKRLSIYMWLRYYNIEDAIVLMDEIEIALHPDWQYKVVSDLKKWASSNQYILATHSYELLQA